MDENEKSLFEAVGGRPTLEKVHKLFYDKVYANPFLVPFFEETNRKLIENQQTDFTASQMGGGDCFSGKTPQSCHQHMFITQEHFNLRNRLLRDSLREFGISDELAEQWLKLSAVFEKKIVKSDMSECVKRFKTDKILTASLP